VLGALLRAGLNFPASWQRRMVVRPLEIDGLRLSPELQLMFLSQRLLRIPEIAKLPLEASRAEMDRQTVMAGGRQHVGAIRDLQVDGAAGSIPARLYIPTERTGSSAALVPLGVIVELTNIGTLFAFILVNIGVIVLRHTRPDLERPFKVPFVPVFPAIGIILCGYLIVQLPIETKLRFVVWLIIGLVIYFTYSRKHSRVRTGEKADLPPVEGA